MARKQVKHGGRDEGCPSRRDVLRAAAAAAALGVLPSGLIAATQDAPASQTRSEPATRPANGSATTRPSQTDGTPWWMGPAFPRSRVVDVRGAAIGDRDAMDEPALAEMVTMGLVTLTGTKTPTAAWRAILGRSSRLLIKFNHVGAEKLATNSPLARVLVESLTEAGYKTSDIVLVEVEKQVQHALGVAAPPTGWGQKIPVGDGEEELAEYLLWAEAVINVPLIKTHRIAGMSGALKNLSHALIRHPARYHANQCSPYVAQIVGHKAVNGRLKLNVANALRTVARGGPEAGMDNVVTANRLLMGFDPLAVDAVAYELLLAQRRSLGALAAFDVPYMVSAAELGVGRLAAHQVERVPVAQGA